MFFSRLRRLDTAADPLHHPHVLVVRQQGVVVADHLQRPPLHLVFTHARIDPEIAEGVVQPVNVFPESEGSAIEGAGSVEGGVAVDEPRVPDRDSDLAFRTQPTIEEYDILRCSHGRSLS